MTFMYNTVDLFVIAFSEVANLDETVSTFKVEILLVRISLKDAT